ncbi:hypothetical protein [Arvimicrobium flavum]|uniref:PIN-like domain-containing protein n=1 Tax=Arvimicrobium flavum TaxID=3393320 RepID=UPI00237B9C52|nr:hypothetical protein [Mesorhizobium shangrilense]
MRIVLDESVPRDLAKALRALGLEIVSFPNHWKGTKNGELLTRVKQAGFDCLLTCDKNMARQQNVRQLEILLAVLPTQRLATLLPQVDQIARSLRSDATPAKGVLKIEFHKSGPISDT